MDSSTIVDVVDWVLLDLVRRRDRFAMLDLRVSTADGRLELSPLLGPASGAVLDLRNVLAIILALWERTYLMGGVGRAGHATRRRIG